MYKERKTMQKQKEKQAKWILKESQMHFIYADLKAWGKAYFKRWVFSYAFNKSNRCVLMQNS